MSDLFSELNEQQRAAVCATEGNLRVIAGAGSGKTKVLVSRYLYLVVEYGIDPADILCVTFTNKAAGEMRRRVRAVLGDGYDTALICTYHGFSARLIRDDHQKLFLPKGFQIMDASVQRSVLGELYQKYELKLDHASFGAFLEKIGRFKRDDGYIPRLFSPDPAPILPDAATTDDRILEEYLQRQKAIYALDFHDLINGALYLLKNDEEVRDKWQNRLNYIQVDEFQDSSAREMELVDLLSARYKNLMIVGDPDQNIYEWRGSEVKLLVDFDKTHENTTTVFLNRNYRSTPQILACANRLIEHNRMRLEKDLFTLAPAGEDVVYYHSESDEKEAEVIVRRIREIAEAEKRSFSEFAVLYRSGFLSRVIEKKFTENGIPYEIFGSVKFYRRMEVQDVVAYLRLIAFDDDDAFRRIVNTPRRKFGRAKIRRLEELRQSELSLFYGEARPSLFSVLENHLGDGIFQASGAAEFVDRIKRLRLLTAKAGISEIVNRTTEATGYENYIRGFGDEERLDNLAEFKRIANEYEANFGEELSLAEFLRQIALQSSEDDEKPKDAVKLMTIHASKGLEFPVVFLIGLSEKIFPSAKTIEERKTAGLEEERRLCYVAITRARERLFLMDSDGALPAGGYKSPSRFLGEIGDRNYRTVGKKQRFEPAPAPPLPTCAAEKRVGDRVAHHAFGEGTILAVDEGRQSYAVRFDKYDLPRAISFSYFSEKRPSLADLSAPPERPRGEKMPAAPSPAEQSTAEKREALPRAERGRENEKKPTPFAEYAESRRLWEMRAEEERARRFGDPSAREERELRRKETLDAEESRRLWEMRAEEERLAELRRREALDAEESRRLWKMRAEEERARRFGDPSAREERELRRREALDAEESRQLSELRAAEERARRFGDPSAEKPRDEKPPAEKPRERRESKPRLSDSPNLWKRDDVPKTGWVCTGVTDLGAPEGICEMCGSQIIRYVHHMSHPDYGALGVGCVCAGRMEGDAEAAKTREREFKSRQARRQSFAARRWRVSRNGNSYLQVKGHTIVLFELGREDGTKYGWKYAFDRRFSAARYATREEAVLAAFDELDAAPPKD